jgi:GH43 family beta-xylosidase
MVFGIGLLPAASAQTVTPPAEASSSASPGTLSAARTFTNPIVEQDAADPWVIWKDGYYYFTFTEGGHISIWKSRSLTQIDRGKKVTVWRPSEENRYRWNIWAPELHWLNGKWYIYYAADDREDANHRMFVLESTSDDAQGSYVEKGMLKPSGDRDDRWAIDGTILQHLDKMYMVWSGWPSETGGLQNLYIAEMENPWTLRGPRVLLSTPETVWEWKINEAPQILQRNGKIFVIYSGNGAWTPRYAVGMLQHTGGDILNRANWKKSLDPVFLSHVGPEGGVYGPGHCSFTRSPDGTQDWILFHARLRDGDGWPGRKTFAQPFTWNADGTPNFGRPIAAGVPLPVPSAEPVLEGTNSSASIAQPVPSSGQSGSWPPNSTRAMFRYERSDAAPGALTNIRINAERTAKALVQQEVFGNFIEHLGGVIYEGVWAQVLLNPNIERVEERQTTPPHWDLGGSASWATGGYLSSRSVRMGNANATLSQRVYLPVHRTRKYALSFFARSAGTGQITVSLRADNNVMGPTVVQTPLAVSGDNWQSHKIEWQITAPSLKKGQATQLVVTHTGGAAVDIDQFQLFPNDAVHGLDPDVLRAAKAWHIPLLRLSGNFSSGYRWRDGIGLRLMRPTRANPAWAGVEPNHFGTDDFLRFSQLIGAVPHIGVNAGNGTPEEAAAWVRYVNGSKFRVPIWELVTSFMVAGKSVIPTPKVMPSDSCAFAQQC